MHTTHNRVRRGAPLTNGAPSGGPAAVVPFDYAANFPIEGSSGTVHESVINISPDGPFVALAISYGFEQDRGQAIPDFLPPATPAQAPGQLTLGSFPVDVLLDGLRVGPRYFPVVFETQPTPDGYRLTGGFSQSLVTADYINRTPVFERLQPPVELEFFFTLIDTASGREFQDQPAFNVASLGEASGKRPFRILSTPVVFQPRTTIRAQIIERTESVSGTLFLVLFGYKILGSSACPSSAIAGRPVPLSGPTNSHVIPFDYVTRFDLTGQTGNRLEDEVSINVEGGFFATSIGYGLQVEDQDLQIQLPPGAPATVDLTAVRLNQLPLTTLVDGFRIKPGFMRLAVSAAGTLNSALPTALANRVFESLNRPEDVSFRYTLFDSGIGRELQSQTIHNIAGLGAADGRRPFKKLARPLEFNPRSTLRVSVDEHFGRGQLYVVLQGFKLLAGAALGGRA
jgi:hypothetical protein